MDGYALLRYSGLGGGGGGGVIVTTAQGGDGDVFWWGWGGVLGRGSGFFRCVDILRCFLVVLLCVSSVCIFFLN